MEAEDALLVVMNGLPSCLEDVNLSQNDSIGCGHGANRRDQNDDVNDVSDVISLDSLGFGPDETTQASSFSASNKHGRESRQFEDEEATSDLVVTPRTSKRSVLREDARSGPQSGPFVFTSHRKQRHESEPASSRATKRQARSTFSSDSPHAFAVDLSIGAGSEIPMLRCPGAPLALIDDSRGDSGSQSCSYSMGTEVSVRIASPTASFGVGEQFEGDRDQYRGGEVDALGHSLHQGHVEDDDVELVLSDMGDSVDSDKLGFPPASPTRSDSAAATHWRCKPHSLATPMLQDQIGMLGADTSRQLHEAIDGGYFTLAEHLIDAGMPLHVRDSAGRQPLHIACEANCKWLVQKLVLAGAGIGGKDKLHRTALECTSSPDVAMVLSQPPRWSRASNHMYPWDFRRRIVALSVAMEGTCEEASSTGVRVLPRQLDLLETLAAGLASFVWEVHEASSLSHSVTCGTPGHELIDQGESQEF